MQVELEDAPVELLEVPAPQAVHVLSKYAPVAVLYFPDPQDVQSPIDCPPVVPRQRPAGQEVQVRTDWVMPFHVTVDDTEYLLLLSGEGKLAIRMINSTLSGIYERSESDEA